MILAALPLLALLAVVGITAFDLLRRPTLRRMALRNIVRRPTEALLVVGGAALGTAIITTAFVVGDTFDSSVRRVARTDFGPIDETIRVSDVADLDAVRAAVAGGEPVPGTDGTLPLVHALVAVASGDAAPGGASRGAGDDRRADPQVRVAEVDFDAARAFGGDPASTGLAGAGPTPEGDEVVVNDRLAEDLAVGVGDRVTVHAYGEAHGYTVRTVLDAVGLTGYADVYLPPGTLARLSGTGDTTGTPAAAAAGAAGEPPAGELLVSNRGGVYDGVGRTTAVVRELETRLQGVEGTARVGGVDVQPTKRDLLDQAEEDGAEVRDLLTMMGTFSIVVGVLLLVNLFVMLAEERKSELGMLRAVGMKRNHLVRLFGLEGGVYSLVAAGVGTVVGLGAGQLMVLAIGGIVADDDDLDLVFAARPSSLVTGALAGLAISLVTVWGTSGRIARLNVIRAIRELPDPPARRASRRRLVLSVLGILLGGLLLGRGLGGEVPALVLVGPVIALSSAVPLLARWLPRRGVVAAAAALSLLWALAAPDLVPRVFEDTDIDVFVVQGLVLVGAAVALVSQADQVWAWGADRLADRGGLAGRLAVAYPLARRVRTAILLAMFSLIVFTLTSMSVLSDANLAQAPRMAEEASAGWDLWVDSSPTNPLATGQVAATGGVADAVPALRGLADVVSPAEPEPAATVVTGVGPELLAHGTPELSERLDRFGSDRAALEAVLTDPTLALTQELIGDAGGPPQPGGLAAGDQVTLTSPLTGREQRLTVAAVVAGDWAGNGVLVAREAAAGLLGPRGVESRHFVRVADGVDPETVADRLTGRFVDRGADAQTFTGVVEDEMRDLQGFMRLMQGYLGLGLVIGIAGLGVVMVRAVRERRRQIGMLRALGFPAAVVRRAFLAEAGFVALQGIVLGIGIGLLSARQLLTSDVFDGPLPFVWPWPAIAVLLVVPGLAALGATLAPAAQAARIRPAATLRIAE